MRNNLEECSFVKMNELMQSFCTKYTKVSNEKLNPLGITPSQAEILLYLEGAGPQKVHEIAQALNMIESNVSNICSRLENAGYVERQRQKDDKRVVKINLTASAKPKIGELKEHMELFNEKMRKEISDEGIQEICTSLTKLNRLFDLLLGGHFCRKE